MGTTPLGQTPLSPAFRSGLKPWMMPQADCTGMDMTQEGLPPVPSRCLQVLTCAQRIGSVCMDFVSRWALASPKRDSAILSVKRSIDF